MLGHNVERGDEWIHRLTWAVGHMELQASAGQVNDDGGLLHTILARIQKADLDSLQTSKKPFSEPDHA